MEQVKDQRAQPRELIIKVDNSIKLDPQNPVPFQYGGENFYVVSGRKYIPLIGKKDNLPVLLLEARLISTTQNACISTIAKSTIGNGLAVLEVETDKIDTEFSLWLENVNNNQQSLNEVLEACMDGERTHGNQFIEIKRGSVGKSKFIKVYTHSLQYCRLSEPDDGDVPRSVFISKKFARKGMSSVDVSKANNIPLWSSNIIDQNSCWKDNGDGTFSTMLHLKNEVSGVDYYGLPASIASLRYQVLEGKSAQYNIDNFENNMILGGMLIFESSMTPEEAKVNAKEIMLSHIGEGKNGRIAVVSSESGAKGVTFVPYNTQKEGSFLELDKRNEEKIIGANNWAKEFCYSDGGSLGKGSGYLRSLWDLKEASLLNPLRKKIIQKVVNPIAKIYSEWMGNKDVAKYKFGFHSAMPFSFMADIEPETFMMVGEARKLAGLEPDDVNGKKYLSEMKSKQNVQSKPAAEKGADNNG